MRHNYDTLYINENIDQILDILDKHIANLPTKISNQTDSKYWT
ncbi:Putative lyase [Rickettsia akari str. Hartford]|uniref:Lyase n=1 Tax=Rickettsia akari (strain Hartford) TaxID=293614 RepID=A8GN38_RICAH|nr:Putative lyase [Rickettsia akari str. Hartford]